MEVGEFVVVATELERCLLRGRDLQLDVGRERLSAAGVRLQEACAAFFEWLFCRDRLAGC
jgi:hypothetical protein